MSRAEKTIEMHVKEVAPILKDLGDKLQGIADKGSICSELSAKIIGNFENADRDSRDLAISTSIFLMETYSILTTIKDVFELEEVFIKKLAAGRIIDGFESFMQNYKNDDEEEEYE